jgi:hypothetical protein
VIGTRRYQRAADHIIYVEWCDRAIGSHEELSDVLLRLGMEDEV